MRTDFGWAAIRKTTSFWNRLAIFKGCSRLIDNFHLDEETETSEYEEIDSDLKLTTKLTPEPKPDSPTHSDSERQQIRVEKELGKIASDIDKVADNLASSQENLIDK